MRTPHCAFIALLVLLHSPSTTLAAKCAAPPMPLPYTAVSVSPGYFVHGIPVFLGEPGQRVALTPSLQLDTTFIPRYTNSCVHNEGMGVNETETESKAKARRQDMLSLELLPLPLQKRGGYPGSFEEDDGSEGTGGAKGWQGKDWHVMCAQVYGGGFDPRISSTFHDNGTNDQINEPWLKKLNYESWHFVTEAFTFSDYLTAYVETNGALPDKSKRNITTTFILPDDGALFGGVGSSALGLTPQSKLLKSLYDNNMVPSTSWSLTNDTLCLGCVDAAVTKGEFQMFKPADRARDKGLPCLLQAKVEALNYHPNAGAEGASLITEPFTACIDPGVTFLVLPAKVQDTFPATAKRNVQSQFDDCMVLKGPPGGEVAILSFKLEGGLEINATIPGAGDISSGDSGNWRVPIGKGGWGAYGADVAVLGRPVLEHAVLKWDSEAQEYGIANADLDVQRKKDIKPLGCASFPTVKKSVTTAPNAGTIVGSIVGGFVSGLAFAAAALFFFKRGQKGVKTKYRSMPSEEGLGLRHISMDSRTIDSRMSGTLINSPPPSSLRETFRSHFSHRSGSPTSLEPQLVADSSIYEAPEGGTAYPSKRDAMRPELTAYSPLHR